MHLSSSCLSVPTAGGAQHVHVSFPKSQPALWARTLDSACSSGQCACVWVLNVSCVQTKAQFGWEPGSAQDIWSLTKWAAEDGDHALTFSQHLPSPGCHGIDPAALVTEWKDPWEEGRFFHWVCDAKGAIQWLTAAEHLRNTKNTDHSLMAQLYRVYYVRFLVCSWNHLMWLQLLQTGDSEYRCIICYFFPH